MSERELEEIEERAEAATEGPWECIEGHDSPVLAHELLRRGQNAIGPHIAKFYKWNGQGNRDTLFCAYAREDIPNLLKEVRRSHAEVKELRKKLREVGLNEISRLGQEIEEPSYNELHKENVAQKAYIEPEVDWLQNHIQALEIALLASGERREVAERQNAQLRERAAELEEEKRKG